MKKLKLVIFVFMLFFLSNLKVYAGANLSVGSGSVNVGDSFTVSVNMSGAAAWNIHVNSSGPVSGCVINQADATADALDTSKTFSATCTATGAGTITINLTGDITSASDGIPVMLSGTQTVTVVEPVNNNNNNPGNNDNSGNNNPAPKPPVNNEPKPNLSNNNKIDSLIVKGYDLKKVDDNNYELTVGNSIAKITIEGTVKDSKAQITGVGEKELEVGLNTFEVIVTAESGAKNVINVRVTRKDGYYLEDLDSVLKDSSIKDIDIIIKENIKITEKELKLIKESKKIIAFNYYNGDNINIYSWILDGSKMNDIKEFDIGVSFESEYIKEIYKSSNYADGKYIHFEHSGKLPKGTKIKLYVGDKFEDKNLVNVYYYNKDAKKLDFIEDNLNVKDGYIEFDINHCSEYFVTMSQIGGFIGNSNTLLFIFIIVLIVETIAIGILSYSLFRKNKK